jgi:outer membrane biosynthesis protein TonB
MRSVRCDACGTKALMAASKCPKCGHGFEVRDGFGEMLPLSHCATCDSYYPAKIGSCKWCGTQPERASIGPYVWKGLGVATFVAMAWGAWLVHDDPPADVSAARMKAMLKPDTAARADSLTTSAGTLASTSGVADSAVALDTTGVVAPLPIDSSMLLVAAVDTAVDTASVPLASPPPADPITSPAPTPAPTPTRVVVADPVPSQPEPPPPPASEPVRTRAPERAPEPVRARKPARASTRTLARTTPPARVRTPAKASPKVAVAKPPAKPPPKTSAKSKSRIVWVNTVARNWVVVRSGASRSARVIASIGPNTRVQLGESKGGWRRIRAKGLAGWVEHRSFFATAGTPRSGGRLAAR